MLANKNYINVIMGITTHKKVSIEVKKLTLIENEIKAEIQEYRKQKFLKFNINDIKSKKSHKLRFYNNDEQELVVVKKHVNEQLWDSLYNKLSN